MARVRGNNSGLVNHHSPNGRYLSDSCGYILALALIVRDVVSVDKVLALALLRCRSIRTAVNRSRHERAHASNAASAILGIILTTEACALRGINWNVPVG